MDKTIGFINLFIILSPLKTKSHFIYIFLKFCISKFGQYLFG